MHDISNLRTTIVPKSDQLNAEQLLGGDMVITVTDVRVGSSDEQPIAIHYEGEDGRPYKPCKTMRKLLIFAWGEDGRNWCGKSMKLFNDEAVRFGGMTVGGIRISHLSDIQRKIDISLTATKGKKSMHTVEVLQVVKLAEVLAAIKGATNRASMGKAKALAGQLTAADDIAAAREAYAARVEQLKKTAAPAPAADSLLPDYIKQIETATSAETAQLVMDEARGVLNAEDMEALDKAYAMAWGE